ncbi:MAG: hypothetical protein R6X25_16000 [Candidatus Krumholzibacteriia bacterium]
MSAARHALVWTVVFGAAFGWLEAAVVIYLRRIYYPGGFAFPLQMIDTPLLAVELAREAATLVMLGAVGMLAGRTAWQRFAAFVLAFGVWDLVYYLGLWLALGWPTSLQEWDILFMLPWPWVGPVYAPATVAVLMIVFGGLVVRQEGAGVRGRADRLTWLLGFAGSGVLLYTWLRDLEASLSGAMPEAYPVPLFLLGSTLLAACGVRFLTISRRRTAEGTEDGPREER